MSKTDLQIVEDDIYSFVVEQRMEGWPGGGFNHEDTTLASRRVKEGVHLEIAIEKYKGVKNRCYKMHTTVYLSDEALARLDAVFWHYVPDDGFPEIPEGDFEVAVELAYVLPSQENQEWWDNASPGHIFGDYRWAVMYGYFSYDEGKPDFVDEGGYSIIDVYAWRYYYMPPEVKHGAAR